MLRAERSSAASIQKFNIVREMPAGVDEMTDL
jgi:hypothetical protein